jgi:hypothetical protein
MDTVAGIRTIDDLRAILADEIAKIRTGTTTAANVNAVTNATGKILSTVKLEMEYNKLLGKTPHIPFIEGEPGGPKQLSAAATTQ